MLKGFADSPQKALPIRQKYVFFQDSIMATRTCFPGK